MSYEDLFSQLNQLRSLYATNREIQEDKHIQKLYEPVTVTYEIYRLAILATDTWEKNYKRNKRKRPKWCSRICVQYENA